MPAPVPYRIAVPDADLEDVRARLANTRWPDEVAGLHWEAGIPLAVVKASAREKRERERERATSSAPPRTYPPSSLSHPASPPPTPTTQKLAHHWATAFDWRALEARLNARPQFKWAYADPDHPEAPPLHIHFFHLQGRRPAPAASAGGGGGPPPPRPAPVLMLHGWPGSFLEFEGVLTALTHPADPALAGLDLVIPSLPGYGFSGPPTTPGWGVRKVARALDALMREGLGVAAYNVQGGDWGALIARALGTVGGTGGGGGGARARVRAPVGARAPARPRRGRSTSTCRSPGPA